MPLALIVAAGAILRFATLDVQSFSDDELFTTWLVRMDVGAMLETIPESEATPPLFYVVEWLAVQVLGTGEVGMRLLPALFGTLTIPVVHAATRYAASERAALAAAALVAVNPFLVWYSQEARAYSLLILLVALSVMWLFAYSREPRRSALVGWALASAAAIATHYFAVFIVGPAAVWLLVAADGPVRRRAAAVAAPALACAALVPLALHQRNTVSDPGGLGDSSVAERVPSIPKNFLTGFPVPAELAVSILAGALAAFALVLAVRAPDPERRGARDAGLLAAAGVLLPLVIAPVGFDYVSSRNVVAALVPVVMVLACGFATTRAGRIALVALCAVSAAAVIGVALSPEHQRRDWRGAADALGQPAGSRAVVFSPPFSNLGPFRVYFGDRYAFAGERITGIDEVVAVGLAEPGGFGPGAPEPPDGPPAAPPRGFRLHADERTGTYRLVRYRAKRPHDLGYWDVAKLALPDVRSVILEQRGGEP